MRHWRPYLWTRPFIVRTDHCSLKHLLDQRLSTIPQHTWVSKLFGYSFTVEYRPGRQNVVADALSRRDEDQCAINVLALSLPSFNAKRKEIADGLAGAAWTKLDGLVLHKGRIFVPDDSSLWPVLLQHAHGTGHEGAQKTLHRLRISFYSPHACRLVTDYVRSCVVCQRRKTEHLHPAGLLQPLELPSSVWADIAMDFVEGFPRIGGKTVVLTVVDRFSKYATSSHWGTPTRRSPSPRLSSTTS